MKTEFFQCNGATERHDEIVKIGKSEYLLIFGFGTDADGNGFTMRRYYDHKPKIAELRTDIESLINAQTDNAILTGFTFNGVNVWLSTENQFNYKAAYDLAVQTNGATLPVEFKLGESDDGTPVYHTFDNLDDFTAFYTGVVKYVTDTLKSGWAEKDSIDYEQLIASC